ncbi:MAG: N4-gp56 family major capsid protein [Rhodopseudomonas sp.]|nr:N4-gp56 family major capsid protein [Rhodopseudomonas sp.]
MRTVIPFGDTKAVKKWSASLWTETLSKSYWERKFIGTGQNSIIQRLTELESGPGDRIDYDLSVQLRGKPTYGDARLDGKQENLKFYSDQVNIDQMRHSVSAGGRMTRKRTAHDLRKTGRDRMSDYWAKVIDEMAFIYLSGARGINEDFIESTDWTGHAGNAISAPDAAHVIYGGSATSKATITSTDKMVKGTIEKASVKATMMRAQDPTMANMVPVMIGGEAHYVTVMSKYAEYDLRNSDTTGWLEIQKAAAAAEGRKNPIFTGGLGMINNVVLHSHESAIRFTDYGAGSNVEAGRALFMGRQAGVIAYGTKAGLRFDWQEETKDFGNEPTVAAGTIAGVKKTRFNDRDFGVIAIDTAAAAP